ncbi:magnesium transporter [Pseudarcicella hirudinis]|uniref:Magnesium transporter MgtE n=1 Tax=Pseudarcicella hirudinis TaxID=1079859 RepID=A0A1I5YIN5_9BACT|nr:magnesium transporter [Pseudarcicella hirudinis]SFQ44028.1 magnesium transporter [Pseudarcicella hirudinis]
MEVSNQHLPFELTKEYIEKIQSAILEENHDLIKAEMEELYSADITSILYELSGEEAHYVVSLLDTKVTAEILSDLDSDERKKLLKNFSSAEIAEYINILDSDDAVDIINEQPVKIREEVIALLKDREQARFIIDLMHYDEDCAGGLMQKELVKINVKQTVTECVEEIRRQAEDVEKVYSVYVVDDDGILLGTVSLKKIILAKRGSKISDVYEPDIVSVQTYMKGEEVADIMQKYDLEAIPVVNIQGRLLGRITIDDVVDFIKEQAIVDVQAMTGISEDVEEDDSVWKLVRSRLPWLLIGMGGSLLGAEFIQFFDKDIALYPILAAFIPIVGSTGGNAGIQSSSLMVQSLADKSGLSISFSERLVKTFKVALMNGILSSGLVFLINLLVGNELKICTIVSLSLVSVILLASFMGTVTPIFLSKTKINPAVASGPFITTANDLVGYGVYFYIAHILKNMF